MKIKVSLERNAYYFLSDITIRKEEGQKEIDLAGRSDYILKTLATAVRGGVLICDTTYVKITSLIKDKEMKALTQASLGIKMTGFQSEEVSEVDIIAVETAPVVETKPEVAPAPAPTPAPAPESTPDVVNTDTDTDDIDLTVLDQPSRKVVAALKKLTLKPSQIKALLEAEQKGAARVLVRRALGV